MIQVGNFHFKVLYRDVYSNEKEVIIFYRFKLFGSYNTLTEFEKYIKKTFTRELGRRGVWQPRFWEHAIRNEDDYRRHMDYVYINPVKHGYVQRVIDWPYSTFHRDVSIGLYLPDWAGDVADFDAGERRQNAG